MALNPPARYFFSLRFSVLSEGLRLRPLGKITSWRDNSLSRRRYSPFSSFSKSTEVNNPHQNTASSSCLAFIRPPF